jgi:hypothetical protein
MVNWGGGNLVSPGKSKIAIQKNNPAQSCDAFRDGKGF